MTILMAIENIKYISQIATIDIETYKNMVENSASMVGFYGAPIDDIRSPNMTQRDICCSLISRIK